MMIGTKRILALWGVSLLSLQLCSAQAPSGDITVPVDDPPVYYLTGGWQFNHQFVGEGGAALPVEFGVYLDHDARGRLKGADVAWLRIGDYYGAAEYKAKGTVSGGGDKPTKMTLSVKFTGRDYMAGVDTKFHVSLNYVLTIEGSNATGVVRGSANLSKLGSASLRIADFTMQRPNDGSSNYPNGAWAAQMSIIPLKKLSGTGNFLVGPEVLPAMLSGKYSEDDNEGYVTLKGKNEGKGSTVKFFFDKGVPVGVKGVLLGQRVQ